MRVLVIGAAGKTGQLVIQAAVAAGHHVTAFGHHTASYDAPLGVTKTEGDATDSAVLNSAMVGQEAVINAIGGGAPFYDTGLELNTAKAIIPAMRGNGVGRLIAISMMGAGNSKEHTNSLLERMLLATVFRCA